LEFCHPAGGGGGYERMRGGALRRGGFQHDRGLIKQAFDRHAAKRYELVGYILPSNLNGRMTSATRRLWRRF
jgi:hypothetical protein